MGSIIYHKAVCRVPVMECYVFLYVSHMSHFFVSTVIGKNINFHRKDNDVTYNCVKLFLNEWVTRQVYYEIGAHKIGTGIGDD